MKTFFKKNNIKKNIEKLNKEIDLKIIKGLPYKAEARRHKFLVSQFYIYNSRPKVSLVKRMSHVLASFLL